MEYLTRKRSVILLLLLLLLCACGLKEGVVQKAEVGYLKFIGNPKNVLIQIDSTDPFELKRINESEDTALQKLFQVQPGKHSVKVFRDGILIVNRTIFMGSQETVEVQIP